MTTKPPLRQPKSASSARGSDRTRQLTSEHIAEHLAAFQAAGGTVEKLGTTQVLKRLPAAGPASGSSAK